MVSGIQLIGVFFGLVLSYFSFLNYKRQEFSTKEFIGWEILWISFVLVTFFPNYFRVFAGTLGAVRAMDLFSVAGFIVILSISFYNHVSLNRLRNKLEKDVRDIALAEIKLEQSIKRK